MEQSSKDTDAGPKTPFDRFKTLTQKLVSVPKKEVDEKREEYKEKRRKERKKGQGKS